MERLKTRHKEPPDLTTTIPGRRNSSEKSPSTSPIIPSKKVKKNHQPISNMDIVKPSSTLTLPPQQSLSSLISPEALSSSLPLSPQAQTSFPVLSTEALTVNTYTDKDSGPFFVYIQKNVLPDSSSSLNTIELGKLLHSLKIQNIVPRGGIKSIGRNRVSIQFVNHTAANAFAEDARILNHGFKTFIPFHMVSRMGLVRGIPLEWTHEEIVSNIELPTDTGKIIKSRRLSRKMSSPDKSTFTWVPTQTVILTFQGQVLPEKVFSFYSAIEVEKYIYPTIQCFKCCRYGHTKTLCRSNPRCFKCGEEHLGETCHIEIQNTKCVNCAGNHSATNRICPEFVRQNIIKKNMTEQNISYTEASKLTFSKGKSYADATNSFPAPQSRNPQTSSHPQSLSHTKTVFKESSPRSHILPNISKSTLDELKSLSLVQNSNSPNGCALQPVNKEPESQSSDNLSQIVTNLIALLTTIISNPSQIQYNAANTITNPIQQKHDFTPTIDQH
jgi:hypothetical protein